MHIVSSYPDFHSEQTGTLVQTGLIVSRNGMEMKLSGKWERELLLIVGMRRDGNGKGVVGMGGQGNQNSLPAHL